MLTKIIRLFIVLCLLCLPAQAGMIIQKFSSSGSTTTCSSCGTCGGCTDADVICKDWDAANGCTWTADTDSGAAGTITTAAHSGTWACTDKGSYALDITYDDNTTGDCYTSYDATGISTEGTTYYAHFYFKLINDVSPGAWEDAEIFNLDNDIDPLYDSLHVVIRYESDYILRLYFNGSTFVADTGTISVGTVYEIGVKWKYVTGANNDEIEFLLNGVSQGSKTDTDIAENYRYVSFGTSQTTTAYLGCHYQIDSLEIDDDTMPAACP